MELSVHGTRWAELLAWGWIRPWREGDTWVGHSWEGQDLHCQHYRFFLLEAIKLADGAQRKTIKSGKGPYVS
jgi:hypothetical protein